MEKEVINTHDQLVAAGGGIAITTCYTPGRRRRKCGYAIYRLNEKGQKMITDPDAAWYDNKMKTFNWAGNEKANVLAEAQAWVASVFSYTGQWVRNRHGDYVLKEINKRFPLRKLEKYVTTGLEG
jgi:hypothetical protein